MSVEISGELKCDKLMNNKQILVVDDEDVVCFILKQTIEALNSGYTVVSAPNGFTAIAHIQQKPFDLIITDYKMPGMNGLELAEIVRQVSPQTRVVLMSGNFSFGDAFETGCLDGYLQKPFRLAQITRIVELAVNDEQDIHQGAVN
jgi:YesN/AraC family two-component response regulator